MSGNTVKKLYKHINPNNKKLNKQTKEQNFFFVSEGS
ncbi:MAG: hypothetical protein FD141_1580 [Fusobacteria bacterium]|nr:MAG: hypothetical protein FD141_1580 [Fusobacteriota bacterium]KAF0230293.1 MAG: hypothetical protein FD182_683 [Fusobacteriota bacterium]